MVLSYLNVHVKSNPCEAISEPRIVLGKLASQLAWPTEIEVESITQEVKKRNPYIAERSDKRIS